MRRLLVVVMVACSSSSSPSPATKPAPPPQQEPANDPTRLHVDQHDVAVAGLPIQGWFGSLPVSGTASIAIDIAHVDDLARAAGTIRITCRDCRIGDDVAKLALGGLGAVDFGHLTIARLELAVEVANGRARVSRWALDSPDLDLRVDGIVDLARAFGDSHVEGCLRFKPKADLATRAPKTSAVLMNTGAELRDDGMFHIRLTGTIDKLQKLNAACP